MAWYAAIKAFHIISIISWMAGLLYLYRLFIYHRMESEAVVMARFLVMERRLWLAITVPAAWGATLSGVGMIALLPCDLLGQGWLQIKLVLALVLLGAHFYAGHCRKAFLEPPFPHTHKIFRVLNEVPTLLMIGIVVLVVLKPYWWSWALCG